MILTCPACGTQYVVKDGAIPEGGRKVRCASCRHSWHQDPPLLELDEPVEADDFATDGDIGPEDGFADEVPLDAPAAAVPDDDMDFVAGEPDPAFDAPYPTAEPDYAPEARGDDDYRASPVPSDEPEPVVDTVDDDFSPFAAREPAETKRRSPIVALLVVVVLVAALAAAFWFLAPAEWKERVGLADGGRTPLQLMMTHSDRQAIAPGNSESLAVSGRVINPTEKAHRVPPIQAELRSKTGQLVYRWTIAPPVATLGAGASAPFYSTQVNVPSGGDELTVSLGPSGA